MPEIDGWTIAASCAIAFVAYFVRGVAGFGSGLIAIPTLALFFPLAVAVPVVVALDYLGSFAQALKQRENVAWGELTPLIPFTLIGVVCALFLFKTLDPQILSRSLGVFVLAFAVYQLLPLPALVGSRLASLPYGFLGGLVGTLFGTGGPLYVIYFNLRGLGKNAFRATFALYFVIDGSIRLSGYAFVGAFDSTALLTLIILFPVAALALFLGGKVTAEIPDIVFKRVISAVLVGSGLALILR